MAKEDTILEVKVRPNASKTNICGLKSEIAVIDVAAPPEEGRANQVLLNYLAKILDVPKSKLLIVRGEASRQKWIKIPLAKDELWQRLSEFC